MTNFIVLLRAINVSGKNILKMAELKNVLVGQGFKDVQTYIQSGNVILHSEWNKSLTKKKINDSIRSEFGLEIEVFVFTKKEICEAMQNNPYSDKEPNRVFITFINKKPAIELIEKLSTISFSNEFYSIIKNVLYFYLQKDVVKAKMSNSFFENKLQVVATGRNMNTIEKLIKLCES